MTPERLSRARATFALAVLLAATLGAPPLARADALASRDSLRLPRARIRAAQLGLLRPDRLEHGSLSFTLASGAGLAGAKRGPSFLLALGLGTVKELWDRRHTRFDPVDLTADAFGAALGAAAGGGR